MVMMMTICVQLGRMLLVGLVGWLAVGGNTIQKTKARRPSFLAEITKK